MFLDWKTQYYENDYTTQRNLHIQCNPIELPMAFFHRTRTTTKKTKKIFSQN